MLQLHKRKINRKLCFFKSVAIIIIWSFFSLQVCWANGSQLIQEDLNRAKVSNLAPDVAINTGDFTAVFKTAITAVEEGNSSLNEGKKESSATQSTPDKKRSLRDTLTNGKGIPLLLIEVATRVFAAMGIGFLLTTFTALGPLSVPAIIAGWILVPMVGKILFPESELINGLAGSLKVAFYLSGVLGIASLVLTSGGTAAAIGIFMNKALLLKVFLSLGYVVASTGLIQLAFNKGLGKSGAARKAILLTPILVLAASAGLAELIDLNNLQEESPDAALKAEGLVTDKTAGEEAKAPVTDKTAGEEAKAPVTDKTAGEENSLEQINIQKSLDAITAEKDAMEKVINKQLEHLTTLEKLFAENKMVLDKYADTAKWDPTVPKWNISDADKLVFEYGVEIPEGDVSTFEQLMAKFVTVFDPQDIKDLDGQVNPITGRDYSVTHLTNVDWQQELGSAQEVTGKVRDAIVAFQEAQGLRPDGDLGPQTRAEISTEYLQEQIQVKTDEWNSSQEEWAKLDAQQKQYNDALQRLAANAVSDAKPDAALDVKSDAASDVKPDVVPKAGVTIGVINRVILVGNFIASYLISILSSRKEMTVEAKKAKVKKSLENLKEMANKVLEPHLSNPNEDIFKITSEFNQNNLQKGLDKVSEAMKETGVKFEKNEKVNANSSLNGEMVYADDNLVLIIGVSDEKSPDEGKVFYFELAQDQTGQIRLLSPKEKSIREFKGMDVRNIKFVGSEVKKDAKTEKEEKQKTEQSADDVTEIDNLRGKIVEKIIDGRTLAFLDQNHRYYPESTYIENETVINEMLADFSGRMQAANVELSKSGRFNAEDITHDYLAGTFLMVDGKLVLVAAVVGENTDKGVVLYNELTEDENGRLALGENKKQLIEDFKKEDIFYVNLYHIEPQSASEVTPVQTPAGTTELKADKAMRDMLDDARKLLTVLKDTEQDSYAYSNPVGTVSNQEYRESNKVLYDRIGYVNNTFMLITRVVWHVSPDEGKVYYRELAYDQNRQSYLLEEKEKSLREFKDMGVRSIKPDEFEAKEDAKTAEEKSTETKADETTQDVLDEANKLFAEFKGTVQDAWDGHTNLSETLINPDYKEDIQDKLDAISANVREGNVDLLPGKPVENLAAGDIISMGENNKLVLVLGVLGKAYYCDLNRDDQGNLILGEEGERPVYYLTDRPGSVRVSYVVPVLRQQEVSDVSSKLEQAQIELKAARAKLAEQTTAATSSAGDAAEDSSVIAVTEAQAPKTYAALAELKKEVEDGFNVPDGTVLVPSELANNEALLKQKLNDFKTVMLDEGMEIIHVVKINAEDLKAGMLGVIDNTSVLIIGVDVDLGVAYYYNLKEVNGKLEFEESKITDLKKLDGQGVSERVITMSLNEIKQIIDTESVGEITGIMKMKIEPVEKVVFPLDLQINMSI